MMDLERRLGNLEAAFAQATLVGATKLQRRRMSNEAPGNREVVTWDVESASYRPMTSTAIRFAKATGGVILSTTAQSIAGDGDSNKVRLLLPESGDWAVFADVDFDASVTGFGAAVGELYVNDSPTAEVPAAILANVGRATLGQKWDITATVANTPVELMVRKTDAGGTVITHASHTTLIAIGGGGGAAASGVPAAHGIAAHTAHATWKLLYTDGSGDEQELSLGPDGQAVKSTGASAAPAFETDYYAISFLINGGGSAITTGVKGSVHVPCAGAVVGWVCEVDTGTITVDVNTASYATTPSYSSMTGGAGGRPNVATGKCLRDIGDPPASWTDVTLAQYDHIQFEVDAVVTATLCTVTIIVRKT